MPLIPSLLSSRPAQATQETLSGMGWVVSICKGVQGIQGEDCLAFRTRQVLLFVGDVFKNSKATLELVAL